MQIAGRVELLRRWKVSHPRCPICLVLAVVVDSSLPIVPSLIVAAIMSSSVASVLTAVGVACRYVPNVVSMLVTPILAIVPTFVRVLVPLIIIAGSASSGKFFAIGPAVGHFHQLRDGLRLPPAQLLDM